VLWFAVDVAGCDLTTKPTVIVSVFASSKPVTVTAAPVVESIFAVVAVIAVAPVPLVTVVVKLDTTADEGATERTPRPNAATATSAMRLNVVFVDICFLSIVELRTIRISA
jgi:hypothetical protein